MDHPFSVILDILLYLTEIVYEAQPHFYISF